MAENIFWISWTALLLVLVFVFPKTFNISDNSPYYIIILIATVIEVILFYTLRRYFENKSLTSTKDLKEVDYAPYFDEIHEILKDTKTDYISINATKSEKPLDLLTSKFGGEPYLERETLKELNDFFIGEKYILLAQINLSDFKDLHNFPNTGILQFFIAQNDMNMKDENAPFGQNQAFVKYIENPDIKNHVSSSYEFSWDDTSPIRYELKLDFQNDSMFISVQDIHFDSIFKDFLDTTKGFSCDLEESFNSKSEIKIGNTRETKHQIGGYPYFTQSDIRDEETKDMVLLLQIDSQYKNNNWEIIWGDAGVANFFIDPKDLTNKDFSKVWFTWDCT